MNLCVIRARSKAAYFFHLPGVPGIKAVCFATRTVDIVPARTRDLAKQLGPNFEEIDNDTPGSQNE